MRTTHLSPPVTSISRTKQVAIRQVLARNQVRRRIFVLGIPLIPLPFILFFMITTNMATSVTSLKIAVLTGSTRTGGAPRPILGPRVCQFVQHALEQRGHVIVSTIHPRQLPLMEQPHFAYSKRSVPPEMQEMHSALTEADAYVTITPEFNHGPSPGLMNTLNHFGSSVFGFKPSLIVSYSASQWGGVRAAHALRPILSELGCLPVSSMMHIPRAQDVLHDNGTLQTKDKNDENENDDDEHVAHESHNEWDRYMDRTLSQLEWWANAARSQRAIQDPYKTSPAFTTTPSQRNAPK